jgi:GTPase SAR1 family protein
MSEQNERLNDFQHWSSWFSGIPPDTLKAHFDTWSRLDDQYRRIQEIFDRAQVQIPGAAMHELAQAARRLDFTTPYRVVVLGESGAGKSSLLNALVCQNLLPVGTGGAVTGVASYISTTPATQSGQVTVTYRTEDEFLSMLQRLGARYHLPIPDSLTRIAQDIEDGQFEQSVITLVDSQQDRTRLFDDIRDIVQTWQQLKSMSALGTYKNYHPEQDKDYLKNLVEEESPLNRHPQSRQIPGIAKVEYLLPADDHGLGAPNMLAHTVLIDTPGVGARTLRHREILQEEVERADAVILVVNATRPGEKAASMAYLLERVLFEGYTPEQKDRFAQKVFLVVNKYDVIRTPDDRRRLQTAIDEISQVIAPQYWTRYGRAAGDAERRYFETIAELAVYAHQRLTGRPLAEEESNSYQGRIQDLGLTLDMAGDAGHQTALQHSKIPDLRNRLYTFLSRQRLHLTLEEVEVRLRNALEVTQKHCQQILQQLGWKYADRLAGSAEAREDYIRSLCQRQLDQDRHKLIERYQHIRKEIHQWRYSEPHKDALPKLIEQVCHNLDVVVRERLGALLDNTNGAGIVIETMDEPNGIIYTEGTEHNLLVRIEETVREAAEQEAIQVSRYFTEKFNHALREHALYNLLEQRSYNQDYLKSKPPQITLAEYQQHLCKEYDSICRWVVLAQMMNIPIILAAEKRDKAVAKVWEDVKAFMPTREDDFQETVGGTSFAAAKKVFGFLQRELGMAVKRESTNPAAPQSLSSPSDLPVLEEEKLVARLTGAFSKKNYPQILELVTAQFAIRCRIAFSVALPPLENLFFYELSKYWRNVHHVIEALHQEHFSRIWIDPHSALRRVLLAHKEEDLTEIDQLSTLLTTIRHIMETPTM